MARLAVVVVHRHRDVGGVGPAGKPDSQLRRLDLLFGYEGLEVKGRNPATLIGRQT